MPVSPTKYLTVRKVVLLIWLDNTARADFVLIRLLPQFGTADLILYTLTLGCSGKPTSPSTNCGTHLQMGIFYLYYTYLSVYLKLYMQKKLPHTQYFVLNQLEKQCFADNKKIIFRRFSRTVLLASTSNTSIRFGVKTKAGLYKK